MTGEAGDKVASWGPEVFGTILGNLRFCLVVTRESLKGFKSERNVFLSGWPLVFL